MLLSNLKNKVKNTFFKNKNGKLGYLYFFLAFLIFQEFSYLGYLIPPLGKVVFLLIVLGTIILTYLDQNLGLLVLIFEFLSGHGGHLFEWGISLRLALFLVVFGFWFIRKILDFEDTKRIYFSHQKTIKWFLPILIFYTFIFLAFVRGIANQHNFSLVLGDFINYSYWLLVFPLFEFFASENKYQKTFLNLAIGCILGISFLTLLVFFLFSFNLVQVHDIFYWWWRKTAISKATAMGSGFFRIVSPSHILVLPLFLLVISLFFKNSFKNKEHRKNCLYLGFCLSLPFLINFSRVYWLAFILGLALLSLRKPFLKNLKLGVLIFVLLILEFSFIHIIASQGTSFGLGFFTGRLATSFSPDEEVSALTRLRILPNLLREISFSPFLGKGLGSEIKYFDPLLEESKTTYHIDWGFFEMWLELGVLGLLAFFLVIGEIIFLLWKIKKEYLFLGLFVGLVSFLFSSLTAPFVFHSVGVFYLSLLFVYVLSKNFSSSCHPSES